MPKLAESLNGLTGALWSSAKLEEALVCGQEVLQFYRRLARQRPEVYRPNVATTLNNLGTVQRDLNDLEAARASYAEALALYQELAAKRPRVCQSKVELVERNLKRLRTRESAFPHT